MRRAPRKNQGGETSPSCVSTEYSSHACSKILRMAVIATTEMGRGSVDARNQRVESAITECASPVVFVSKKNQSPRFCVDYYPLKAVTVCDIYSILRMNWCIDPLKEACFI